METSLTQEQWYNKVHEACETGNVEVLQKLIRPQYKIYKEKLHRNEDECFRQACICGHLNVVEFLMNTPELHRRGFNKVNINQNKEWALRWAAYAGHLHIVEVLLKHPKLEEWEHKKPKIWCKGKHNEIKESVWIDTCMGGQLEVAKWLIKEFPGYGIKNFSELLEYAWIEKCHRSNEDAGLLKWLIFEYKMNNTETAKEIQQRIPEIKGMFDAREAKEALEKTIASDQSKDKDSSAKKAKIRL